MIINVNKKIHVILFLIFGLQSFLSIFNYTRNKLSTSLFE